MTNPLPPLKYGKVVGRFLGSITDSPDVDALPDFPPLTGLVHFAADVPKYLVPDADPPATVAPLNGDHMVVPLDDEGYLTWRNERGVRLPAPVAGTMNPSSWTYRVSFDLKYLGQPVPIAPYYIEVPEYIPGPDPQDPDTGSTGLVDLTVVSPVPSSAGNAVVVGPQGTGLQIDDTVATYAALPAPPPEGDGAQYVVKADGLLYIYDADTTSWTPEGDGVVLRGPEGSLAGTVNVKEHGALGDGVTDDTTAIADAYAAAAGKPLYFPSGTYVVTALPALANGDRLIGTGYASEIRYTGTGTLLPLTGKQDIALRNLSLHLSAAGATGLDLSGCFQIQLDDVRIRGEHTGATGTTYHGQTGIILRDNTGNTRIHTSVIANLGTGIESRCIQNELTNSKVVNCYKGVLGVGGTATAGLVAIGCEFIGDTDPDTVAAHVDITGTASTWYFSGCWFEGSDYGLIVGVFGSGGPSSFTLVGCKIAARVVGIQFNNARQPSVIACEFNLDAGGTMTEIAFGGTPAGDEVIEGIAINLVTTLRSDFNDADFPQYWNVFRRGSMRSPNITSSSNITVSGTVDTGNLKVRNGTPAIGEVLTAVDADGNATWQAAGGAPDATTTTKGIVQLAGILAGTATAPAFNAAAFGTTSTTACVGDDARLSDARTPTAAGQVYDFTMKTHMGARAAGAGNVIPEGVRVERAISISQVTFRGETAGTGDLIVELRKNGSNTGMPAASTISAANHATDTVVTAGGPWSVAAGDRITVHITTADSPAGNGLQASIKATTT